MAIYDYQNYNYGTINKSAADRANAESAAAQERQFQYNQTLQNAQIGAQIAMQNSANAFAASEAEKARLENSRLFGITQNFNAEQQSKSMEFNSVEAQKQREWQEYMASTAIQRQVEDMKRAGINPILAAQYGGAAFGSGSSASFGSSASVSPMSAQKAEAHMGTASGSQVGTYTGVIENTSNLLAAIGAGYNTIDTLGTAIENWINDKKDEIKDKANPLNWKWILRATRAISNAKDAVEDFIQGQRDAGVSVEKFHSHR